MKFKSIIHYYRACGAKGTVSFNGRDKVIRTIEPCWVRGFEKRLYRRLAWNRDEKRETKAMLALNDTLKTFPDLDVEALAAYESCQDMDIVSISADGANNLFVTLR